MYLKDVHGGPEPLLPLRLLLADRALPLAALQISTTKGTGGDIIILEEAAYIDPGFFYVSARPVRETRVVLVLA